MINRKTVFVLGAGSSNPYGYPVMSELKDNICTGFLTDYEQMGEIDKQDAANFVRRFRDSNAPSIDQWLRINHVYDYIGKLAIANDIIKKEKPNKTDFTNKDKTPHWFGHLYQEMLSGINDLVNFKNNNISFITFNYDRVLEYLLYQSTKNMFTLNSEKDIKEICGTFTIVHVYGCVDEPPWANQQFVYGEHNTLVGASITFRKMAASRIKVIGEPKRANDNDIDIARNLIKNAEAIYFLGFSYDPDNLALLGIPKIFEMSAAGIYGTAFGMLENKRFDIQQSSRPMDMQNNFITITDCTTLLRMHPLS